MEDGAAVHHMQRVFEGEWGTHRSHAALTRWLDGSLIYSNNREVQSVGLHVVL